MEMTRYDHRNKHGLHRESVELSQARVINLRLLMFSTIVLFYLGGFYVYRTPRTAPWMDEASFRFLRLGFGEVYAT